MGLSDRNSGGAYTSLSISNLLEEKFEFTVDLLWVYFLWGANKTTGRTETGTETTNNKF